MSDFLPTHPAAPDVQGARVATVFVLHAVWLPPLGPREGGAMLAGLPFTSGAQISGAPRLICGGDLRYWSAAAALAQEMLVRQWYVPGVVELPRSAQLGYGSSFRRAGPLQPSVGASWYAAL